MKNSALRASDIGQIAITVGEISTALPFYRDVLGPSLLFQPDENLTGLMEEVR